MMRALFGIVTVLIVSAVTLEALSLVPESEIRNFVDNLGSCVERCGKGVDPNYPCQCNSACTTYNDCCPDYIDICIGSCIGRCDQIGTNASAICQCNRPCMNYGDCCPDFSNVCNAGPVTDQELRYLSEELLTLDANNAVKYVKAGIQERGEGCSYDLAPERLLTVNPNAYKLPTIARLLPLLDNYIADVNIAETVTETRQREQNQFIDAIFATPVMQRAQSFLQEKGFPYGKSIFAQEWFDFYVRGTGALGSSGFEHVFLAEIKNNAILGGHGWLFFSEQERLGSLNYRGYRNFIPDIGGKGSILEHVFTWRNYCKPVSSMFIGTSPELDLALFTVCFHSRNNAKCPISLGGKLIQIQTYDITQNGKTFVASAYPDIQGI